MLRRLLNEFVWGFQLMVRPVAGFQRIRDRKRPRARMLQVMLAGVFLVQVLAELLGYRNDFPMGKIMSGALILGPMVGLLLLWLGASWTRHLACLLQPDHVSLYQFRHFRAPIPLRGLIWNRVFGRKNIFLALKEGRLKGYQDFWNRMLNGVRWGWGKVSGGGIPFRQFTIAAVRTTNPLMVLGLVRLCELILVDKNESAPGWDSWAILELGLLVWFVALWVPLVRVCFRISWGRSLAAALLGFCVALILVVSILRYIFAVPIPGL